MRSWRIVVVLISLVCATACRGGRRGPNLGSDPLKGAAREAALAAVGNLRNLLNTGGCQEIYDQADESLRRGDSPEDWLRQCERMREKLGTWQSFDAERAVVLGGTQAQVEGPAVFSKGAGRGLTIWVWNDGHPRLTYLSLQARGETASLPSRYFLNNAPVNKYWDPPIQPLRMQAPAL
jgi:hypothetical protein